MPTMKMKSALRVLFSLLLMAGALGAQEIRLVRSLSGPSGKVQGSAFLFDERRTRFVHPQDKAFVVYFEWEAPPGLHVLAAHWKGPDGRTISISPEVKVETATNTLASYWHYTIDPDMAPGLWTVEIRADGRPAGSHSFEIAGTATATPPTPPPSSPKYPTVDQIFRTAAPSVAFVHKLSPAGKRYDSSLGFVVAKNRLATAFQAIDGAAKLEVAFPGGPVVVVDEVLAYSRMADWAILPVETADLKPIPAGDAKAVAVGERVIVFNLDGDAMTIGGVDISGRRTVPVFGERIQFSPAIGLAAVGGPLLDKNGNVAAILGGSMTPGGRFDSRHMSIDPSLGLAATMVSAATPLPVAPDLKSASKLGDLLVSGELTQPLSDMEGFLYGTTSTETSKSASAPLPRDVGEFSRRDKQVWVLAAWQKKGKTSKGMVSGKVYDTRNRLRVTVPPRKVSLSDAPSRFTFGFAPADLEPGIYRIDLLWDDQPVWRTLIRIAD